MTTEPTVTSDDRPTRVAYTPREVAAKLGISYRRVLNAIAAGDLRARRIGPRHYAVPVDALDEYLRSTG